MQAVKMALMLYARSGAPCCDGLLLVWEALRLHSVFASKPPTHPPPPLHYFFPSVCPLMNMYKVSVIRLHFYKIHSKDICKYAYLSDPPDMFTCRVCKSSEIQAPISSSHSRGLVWSVLWTTFQYTHKGICSIGALEQEYKMNCVCPRGTVCTSARQQVRYELASFLLFLR